MSIERKHNITSDELIEYIAEYGDASPYDLARMYVENLTRKQRQALVREYRDYVYDYALNPPT